MTVAASGLRWPATVRRLLGEAGDDEEEAQGVEHGEGKNRGPCFRKKDHLTKVFGVFIDGECNVFSPF